MPIKAQRRLKPSVVITALLLLSPGIAFANMNPALAQMNIGIIARIVQSIAVVMGLGMVLGAIYKLKQYGEMRSMMSPNVHVSGALFMLLAGIILLLLPTMLNTALFAFWGSANPLPYPTVGDQGLDALIPVIVMFVRLLGVISFIRGVVLISHLGQQNGQPGTLGKALVHIFAGILCIQIIGTAQLLQQILGLTGA